MSEIKRSAKWRLALAGLAAVAIGSAADAIGANARFCIVPVKDGEATDKDHNQSFRLVGRVVMLPGVSRPIIYPRNRGGVWTVDENGAFVPYGGRFPSNSIHDKFAFDSHTGTVAGVNSWTGLFANKVGQATFEEVLSPDGKSLPVQGSIAFVARWKSFVVPARDGLYRWAPGGAAVRLEAAPGFEKQRFGAVIDLPEINALLVSNEPEYFIRRDSGELELLGKLKQWDFIVGGEMKAQGAELIARSYRQGAIFRREPDGSYTLQEAREDPRGMIAKPFEPQKSVRARTPGGLQLVRYGDGKIYVVDADGTKKLFEVPFDTALSPVTELAEMPASQATIIFSSQSIHALDADGSIEEVENAANVGTSIDHAQGVIPVVQKMLVLGKKGLFLLVDRKISGDGACSR